MGGVHTSVANAMRNVAEVIGPETGVDGSIVPVLQRASASGAEMKAEK